MNFYMYIIVENINISKYMILINSYKVNITKYIYKIKFVPTYIL